jgi:hypothetical protein
MQRFVAARARSRMEHHYHHVPTHFSLIIEALAARRLRRRLAARVLRSIHAARRLGPGRSKSSGRSDEP